MKLTPCANRYTSAIKGMAKAKKQDKKPEKQRRKEVHKDKAILIRVTEAQKALLAEAAGIEHHALSPWVLSAALREAERVIKARDQA